ncbi:hypothetical protein K456DRAFT_39206 [Colletotrichum gloeosporioides 23]|nr:hypothetical protein K456DRAFT_39206 [Colletotrichum gloeosporioides 23]
MAAKLLMEPALSSVHQGWMHLLLAGSPHDYVHHANEAVRLFTEVLDENKPAATPHELDCMTKTLEKAKDAQRQALSDKRAADRKAAEALLLSSSLADVLCRPSVSPVFCRLYSPSSPLSFITVSVVPNLCHP